MIHSQISNSYIRIIISAMTNIAILYMSHFITDRVIGRFHSLNRECAGPEYHVSLLFDSTREPAPKIAESNVHSFDLGSVAALGFPMLAVGGTVPRIVPGNTDYALMQFYLSYPFHDFYWLVEYDVRFTGSWRHFFATCDLSTSDLLATTLQEHRDNRNWYWWDSLRLRTRAVDRAVMRRAFLPIYRLSRTACRILVEEYRKGWEGHFEVRLPTVLSVNGCSLEDIGGDGRFVPPGHVNRFYIGEHPSERREATFRWRPVMREPGLVPNMLWHPVKDQS